MQHMICDIRLKRGLKYIAPLRNYNCLTNVTAILKMTTILKMTSMYNGRSSF